MSVTVQQAITRLDCYMALYVIGKKGAFNNEVFENQAGILQEHSYIYIYTFPLFCKRFGLLLFG